MTSHRISWVWPLLVVCACQPGGAVVDALGPDAGGPSAEDAGAHLPEPPSDAGQPGCAPAPESFNGVDDDCDGKIDNHVPGVDFDQDGTVFPQDCNDDDRLVGPNAVDVLGDGVDNDCDGHVDVAPPSCDLADGGTSPEELARALGLCRFVQRASVIGDPRSRARVVSFGTNFAPAQGATMVLLATGRATDNVRTPNYHPKPGLNYQTTGPHPLYSPPRCGALGNCPAQGSCGTFAACSAGKCQPLATDLSELSLSIRVPQNARSLSFRSNFFTAEYPEYLCRPYNDRFIALLASTALAPSKLPGGGAGQCRSGASPTTCNVAYDSVGEPLTVNNGFFSICTSTASHACTRPASLLAMTGYDRPDGVSQVASGATGWLLTRAPVTPGEEITLRFIILDEGDAVVDSAVLVDDFQWEAQPATAPSTEPVLN